MRRAFTLVETLIAIGIVVLVAAISFPVMRGAKRGALKLETKSNMRQLWLAIEIYVTDNDGRPPPGKPSELALPPDDVFFAEYSNKLELTPPFKGAYPNFHNYFYYAPNETFAAPDLVARWRAWTEACGSQTILIADFNFTEAGLNMNNPYQEKYGLGITLGGTHVSKSRIGDVYTLSWWSCPQVENKP